MPIALLVKQLMFRAGVGSGVLQKKNIHAPIAIEVEDRRPRAHRFGHEVSSGWPHFVNKVHPAFLRAVLEPGGCGRRGQGRWRRRSLGGLVATAPSHNYRDKLRQHVVPKQRPRQLDEVLSGPPCRGQQIFLWPSGKIRKIRETWHLNWKNDATEPETHLQVKPRFGTRASQSNDRDPRWCRREKAGASVLEKGDSVLSGCQPRCICHVTFLTTSPQFCGRPATIPVVVSRTKH